MRIAFDVGPLRARPAGVGQYVYALANALANELPPGSLAFIGKHPDAVGLPDSVPAVRRPASLAYPIWVELMAGRDGRRSGADLVHCTDGLVPPVRWGRTVVTVHDLSVARLWMSHPARRWLRIPFILASPRLADVVVVPSRATADEVMRSCGVAANRIELVPNAPQPGIAPVGEPALTSVLAKLGLSRGRFVLAPGTIEPRKNHVRLVRAFERLASTDALPDDVVLAIVGARGWGYRHVLDAIERSPAHSRIRLLGYVTTDQLSALLTGAGVVAYPSLYEGFGLPVVEAMSCGAATVTSNCSSMPEVAGDAGYLVDPRDVNDIARGIREAWADMASSSLAVSETSMRQAARFSWAISARKLGDLYTIAVGLR